MVDETSPRGDGFLADLCLEWENAAKQIETPDLRVLSARFGMVLGTDGGALPKMMFPFQWFLGGPSITWDPICLVDPSTRPRSPNPFSYHVSINSRVGQCCGTQCGHHDRILSGFRKVFEAALLVSSVRVYPQRCPGRAVLNVEDRTTGPTTKGLKHRIFFYLHKDTRGIRCNVLSNFRIKNLRKHFREGKLQ